MSNWRCRDIVHLLCSIFDWLFFLVQFVRVTVERGVDGWDWVEKGKYYIHTSFSTIIWLCVYHYANVHAVSIIAHIVWTTCHCWFKTRINWIVYYIIYITFRYFYFVKITSTFYRVFWYVLIEFFVFVICDWWARACSKYGFCKFVCASVNDGRHCVRVAVSYLCVAGAELGFAHVASCYTAWFVAVAADFTWKKKKT